MWYNEYMPTLLFFINKNKKHTIKDQLEKAVTRFGSRFSDTPTHLFIRKETLGRVGNLEFDGKVIVLESNMVNGHFALSNDPNNYGSPHANVSRV